MLKAYENKIQSMQPFAPLQIRIIYKYLGEPYEKKFYVKLPELLRRTFAILT